MNTYPNDEADQTPQHGPLDIEALRKAAQAKIDREANHAPKGDDRARKEWEPIPLSHLGPSVSPDWVWPGYIAKGYSTLLSALWKAGKTTLLSHILRDAQRGGGLLEHQSDLRTLVVSEESPGHWRRRREELNLTDAVAVIARPFKGRPKPAEWAAFTEHVTMTIKRDGFGFVIFDTLPSLWCVADENDASSVTAALMPLNQIMAEGAGLLLVHHNRKSDGNEGQASRGSGALPSWADCILELRRYSAESTTDRRRTIRAYSRFDETRPEAVLELTTDGYRVIGDKAEITHADRMNAIDGILNGASAALTSDDVLERWPTANKPGKRILQEDLIKGATSERWCKIGKGTRGDAFRFHPPGFVSRTTNVLDTGNESPPTQPPPPMETKPPTVGETPQDEPQEDYEAEERLGMAEELGMDTSPGSAAHTIAHPERKAAG